MSKQRRIRGSSGKRGGARESAKVSKLARSGSPVVRALAERGQQEERAERLTQAMVDGVAVIENALMAEQLASVWFVPIADDDAGQETWVLGKAICDCLERRADADALTALVAMHAIAPERLTARLARGVERLRGRGIESPDWADAAGSAMRPIAAIRADSEWWDDCTIIAIECGNGRDDDTHSLVMSIENNSNETIAMKVLSPLDQLRKSIESQQLADPDDPERRFVVSDIPLDEAATRMLAGLGGVPLVGIDEPDFEKAFEMVQQFQLFEARVVRMSFIRGFQVHETLDLDERADVADEFILHEFSTPVRTCEWIEEFLFGVLEFMSEDVGGSALRWSPRMIDEFITYFVLDELIVEPSEAERVVEALEQLSRFFHERRALPAVALEMCLAKVAERREDVIEGLTNLKHWRPARRMVLEMRRADVDIEEQSATEAFIARFNQRIARGEIEDW